MSYLAILGNILGIKYHLIPSNVYLVDLEIHLFKSDWLFKWCFYFRHFLKSRFLSFMFNFSAILFCFVFVIATYMVVLLF